MYLTGRYIIRHQLRVADTLSDTTPEEAPPYTIYSSYRHGLPCQNSMRVRTACKLPEGRYVI